MRQVGTVEVKERLNQLLDEVEAGENVEITRNGRTVARLVPWRPAADPETARAAARAIRAMSAGVRLGGTAIKALIEEGRH